MALFYLSWNQQAAAIAKHVENTRSHKRTATAISITKIDVRKVAPQLDALEVLFFQDDKIT